MPARVSDGERQAIIAELATGKSCRAIARQFGRAATTISRIAAEAGHDFGRHNVIRAGEISRRYSADRRAALKLQCVGAAERLLGQLFAPSLVYAFGGRDNTYNEHTIPEPGARDKRDLAQAVASLMRVVSDMERVEAERVADGVADIRLLVATLREQRDRDLERDADGGDAESEPGPA